MIAVLLAFVLYFGSLLCFGFYFYKKNRNEKSFLLANRSLNYWVTAISAQSSDMGSWLFLGYPAMIFSYGLTESWTAIGLVFFMFLNWKFVAAKLRDSTEKYHALTISSFFYKRFNSRKIKILSAAIAIFFFTCYLSSGLVGIGRLFESSFGMDYFVGIITATIITIIYILFGGYFAVAWSNMFQGLFLLLVIVIVPTLAAIKIGDFEFIKIAALEKGFNLSLIPKDKSIFEIILLTFGFGLGYFGQPHILVNFMSIDNSSQVKKATFVGITWQIIVLMSAIFMGFIGIAYFKGLDINPEHIFVEMAQDIFTPFVYGLALCGILAACLSTLNSQLMVASGSFAEDLYPEIKNNPSQKEKFLSAHVAIVLIAITAMIISFFNTQSIYNLVRYAWSGLGASFGPAVIHGLYAKKTSSSGVFLGMIAGALISAFWPFLQTGIPELIPAFIANYAIICLIRFLN